MLFGLHQSKVYVEIDNSHVLIGMLHKNADKLTCDVFDEYSFRSLEVGQGAIYNLSEVCSFITKALERHLLHGAKAVVCCPYLVGCDEFKKQLASLQVSLCVCKAGLRIESIYDERILLR